MAGGKANTFDNQLLLLIFNGIIIPGIAQNVVVSPLLNFCVALHTADPGVGGSQNTNEATYPGYARATVPRTASGFSVTGNACVLGQNVTFSPCNATYTETEGFFSVGTVLSGSGIILYRGPLTPVINVIFGTVPQLTAGTTITEN
jgi:hypothetical protein